MGRDRGRAGRRGASLLGLLTTLTLSAVPAHADDCSAAGTQAFRTAGVDAAFEAFAAARAKAECANDPQLAFNYARTLQTLLDRDGDDLRACDGAEAYAAASTGDLPGPIRALAATGRAELGQRCEAVRAAAPAGEDYSTLVARARSKVRAGDRAGAAEDWKTASEQTPDAALPHRALCSLLPGLGREDEGRGHCRRWRELEPSTGAGGAGGNQTRAWVLTAAAVASLAAGGVMYSLALDETDAANRARSTALTARDRGDLTAYDTERRALDDAIDAASTYQTVSFVLLGAGAALGAWAAYSWLDDGGSPVATVRFDGSGVRVEGRW